VSPPTHRAGRQAAQAPSATPAAPVQVHHAPHAALLIDFDNVTLGIRSDLTKELRTLLNSDIIRGKVAVQRAYADWRRYPQYIVPLSESSIDLIFAPAFGTNKKNATDIRLAVDATELVFTRPEIGTFILLSGDSDFSSLVIKLKEYGKYVIGVGIRESASDLLIQNCDEYYSYSDLAGLTKEADLPSTQRDPWELVGEAVAQMSRSGDVMRSDRLKQVMQQIDPNFDEGHAGFNRFSKFVTEAGNRGLLKVTKQDNGQYEVAPLTPGLGGGAVGAPRGPAPGARDADREDGRRRGGGGRGRGRGRGRGGDRSEEPPREAETRVARTPGGEVGHLTLASAFQLVTRALEELPSPTGGEALRARMAALYGKEDALLEPARFARLLRQANDAEIADVRQIGDGSFEVAPHKTDLSFPRNAPVVEPVSAELNGAPAGPAETAPRIAALRFRRGTRAPLRMPEVPLVGFVRVDEEAPAIPSEPDPLATKRPGGRGRGRGRAKSGAPAETGAEGVGATAAEGAVPAGPRRPRRRAGRSPKKSG